MKVLQINSVCGTGSTGKIVTDIHNELLDQGHESYVAYGRGEARNCENAIKIGDSKDLYFHVTKTRVFDRHGFASKKATDTFIEKVKAIDPDVIHLHNIHGYYLNIEVLFNYLKKANKKVLWTLHDCWAFTGHCTHFEYSSCQRWLQGCYSCPQKNDYPKSIGLDKSKENYIDKKRIFNGVKNLTIITPSKWLAKNVECSFLGDYPVKVINNGIDTNIFKPQHTDLKTELGIEDKKIYIGVAGNWTVKKGYNQFINLSYSLKSNEIIILVGVSKKQKRNLPKNIIGITHTENQKELAEYYSIADIFINPTLEDTFPTTNIEALACGTPVLTFDSGGSPEIVDEFSGKIIEQKNTFGVLQGIDVVDSMSISPLYLNKMVKTNFDKTKQYYKYIQKYI